MTVSVSAVHPSDPPVIAGYHLNCLLACSDATLKRWIAQGIVPRPDARIAHRGRVWKLSTLRAWRPDLAEAVRELANRPPIRLLRDYPVAGVAP